MRETARGPRDHHGGRSSLGAVSGAVRVVTAPARRKEGTYDDEEREAASEVLEPFSPKEALSAAFSNNQKAQKP